MEIDKYKLKLNMFTSELEEELQRDEYVCITTEAQIHDVATPDNNDGTFDKVYKAKVCGRTIVTQGDKVVIAKSKHSRSQALRRRVYLDNPDEEYYQKVMNAIITNYDDIIDYLIQELGD